MTTPTTITHEQLVEMQYAAIEIARTLGNVATHLEELARNGAQLDEDTLTAARCAATAQREFARAVCQLGSEDTVRNATARLSEATEDGG